MYDIPRSRMLNRQVHHLMKMTSDRKSPTTLPFSPKQLAIVMLALLLLQPVGLAVSSGKVSGTGAATYPFCRSHVPHLLFFVRNFREFVLHGTFSKCATLVGTSMFESLKQL